MPAPTIDGRGPLKWNQFPVLDGPAGAVALTVDGHAIQGSIAPWSQGWSPAGTRVLMGDGTHAHQLSLPKPKQPITMEPRSGSFEITITHQQDLIRLHRAVNRGSPVLLFMGEFLEEQWLRRNGDAGQTEWRTSRRLGWNGTTRTHETHPPRAYIETAGVEVEQTIVTSGTPTAGEVLVPTAQTADQFYDAITTPALSAGDYLILQYWPEVLVSMTIQNTYDQTNDYRIAVTLEEMLAGEY